MTHYMVITQRDISELVRAVNDSIKLGWQPVGGIALGLGSEGGTTKAAIFYQAMIK
jgi:hypothetical protein